MKATFTIPVTIERLIQCFTCDHCHEVFFKEKVNVRLPIIGEINWKTEITKSAGYNCKLLKAYIRYPESENPEHCPCKFEKWQQTNTDFELTDEVFTIHFQERNQQ